MRLFALAVALVAIPSVAFAGRLEVGAGLGLTQSAAEQEDGVASSHTLGLYGRIGVAGPLSAQVEASRLDLPGSGTSDGSTVRTVSADLVFELGHRNLVPLVLVGVGLDRATQFGDSTDFKHEEVGAGVEYRLHGGFVVGFDARMGTRNLRSEPVEYSEPPSIGVRLYSPASLSIGGYRSARLTIGVRF